MYYIQKIFFVKKMQSFFKGNSFDIRREFYVTWIPMVSETKDLLH